MLKFLSQLGVFKGEQSGTALSDEARGRLQIVLVAAVLVLGILANILLSSNSLVPGQSADGPVSLLVEVMQPEVTNTPVKIEATGVIQARNAITLTPQVSGRVIEASPNLASGGYFEAGEVLFRLDSADYIASADQASADVLSAQADLDLEMAEAAVAKREWALVSPDEPIPDLVARKPQISQARSKLESRQAALSTAELNISRANFSLPFDGRVVSTTIEVGQTLATGQSYGDAYDVKSIEVSLPLSAGALNAIEPALGREAVVRLRGGRNALALEATVTRIDAELNEETRLTRVILRFSEQTSQLPGAFVEAEIDGPSIENARLVPERALSENRTIWVVEDGRLSPRRPDLYFERDGMIVTGPFDTAEGVIVTALSDPSEGTPVVKVPAKETSR